jgi:multidrug efflux pump subunit AcrB
VALFASLIVAYIFTPYLSLKLLKKPTHKHHHDDDEDLSHDNHTAKGV